jgi:hypothetical protein
VKTLVRYSIYHGPKRDEIYTGNNLGLVLLEKYPEIAHSGAEPIKEEVKTASRQYLMTAMTSEADINSQL